jgi:hypothetical protein
MTSSTKGRHLLVAGSVCRIISGLDLREPLHADGADFCDPVLERGALNVILDLAITQGAFEGDELPLLEGLGEFGEVAPGEDAMPFGNGSGAVRPEHGHMADSRLVEWHSRNPKIRKSDHDCSSPPTSQRPKAARLRFATSPLQLKERHSRELRPI